MMRQKRQKNVLLKVRGVLICKAMSGLHMPPRLKGHMAMQIQMSVAYAARLNSQECSERASPLWMQSCSSGLKVSPCNIPTCTWYVTGLQRQGSYNFMGKAMYRFC